MTYKMREIEKVELWNKPWFGNKLSETVEMSYEGKGEWSISDYEWYVTDGSNKDTRYYFICTYVDGFKECWAYYSDDCRGPRTATPEIIRISTTFTASTTRSWANGMIRGKR